MIITRLCADRCLLILLDPDNYRALCLQVLVEGNIGVGKSTFLDLLQENTDVEIYPEPVQLWKNINGHNALVSSCSNTSEG